MSKGKTRYQFMSLLHEVLYFFISSFFSFPSFIENFFLCFVHSDVLEPPLIHSALEEESIPSSCVVDTDLVPSPLPILKDEICITPPLRVECPCSPEEVEDNSQSSQTLLPPVFPTEPSQPLVESHDQPTAFQVKIRNRLFKPLRLPYHLNPYPHDFFEYLPRFSGEGHVTAEKHMEAFETLIDQFEIIHEDVVMRMFSRSLSGDAAAWFRCLETGSIGSWTELYHAFLKGWGENKSLDQYWSEFNALRRGEDEALVIFNRRFFSAYHSMPVEIRPTETAAMVYYIMAQHLELVFLLRERKSSSLIHLFEDAIEVEENIRASRWTHKQADLHIQEEENYQSVSESEQGYSNYGSDLEQEPRNSHYDLDPAAPLFEYHLSGVKAAVVEDPEWFSHKGEGHSFVSRKFFAEEHPGLLKRPGFCHNSHDPVAICMESYISDFLKCSNNISPPILTGEYCSTKDFQDHIIEHVPLLIKERPWVEISSTRLVGSTEQHKEEGRQLISCPEPVCGQVSSGIGRPASVLRPLVHSEGSEEDFPVFMADALSNSFEEIIEDFLDALASAPDEPAVSKLNEEAIVEEDCFFFLHEISHDVFTFGIEREDRETVPCSQDGGVHEEDEEEPEEQPSTYFIPEPVSKQPLPEISEPTSVIHPPVLIRDIRPCVNNCVAEEAVCRQFPGIGHSFNDPVSKYMEWHFPYALEPPYPISTSACKEKLKSVTVLLSRLHQLFVIIDRRKELPFRKLLDWLWWKSAFT
jgi:hypothetical protein